jgi:hypothetical protein
MCCLVYSHPVCQINFLYLAYPAEEAASRDSLNYRLTNASNVFRLCCNEDNVIIGFAWLSPMIKYHEIILIGFICGTASVDTELTHGSMSVHNKEGSMNNFIISSTHEINFIVFSFNFLIS